MTLALSHTSTFVARERELARLDAALEQALGGQLSISLVAGEAGAGKSALVTEFARRAAARHEELAVAIGDCNAQSGAGDPYLPFREVLSLLVGATAADGGAHETALRMDLMRQSLRALAENAPDLIGLFIPAGAILARLGGLAARRLPWAERLETKLRERTQERAASAALEQSHLFEQYGRMLRAIGAEHPLIIVLDDLHWVDAGSAGLLFHLARRLRDSRILLIGTYRAEEVGLGRGGERHPLEPVLHELQRYHGDVVIDLGNSAEAEDRQRLDALIDIEPNALTESFRAALHAHTRGHPLFTLELLRNLQENGYLVRDEARGWVEARALDWQTMAPRVEGVIGERLARLAAPLREVLQVASVEGEEFTGEVIACVQRADERDTVRQLSGELDRQHHLVRARELRQIGGQRLSRYQFRHNLIQKYLYHTLDDIERSYLHEDVANALERMYGEHAPSAAVELAHHFELAGQAGKALHYRHLAARRARELHATQEAAAHYQQALALLDDGATPVDPVEACQICEGYGDVLQLGGRHEQAVAAYRRAIDKPPVSCEHTLLARLWRKSAQSASGARRSADAETAFAAAARELDAAAAADEECWRDEWVQLQVDRLTHYYWIGDAAAMEEIVERARPVIEQHGSAQARSEFFHRQVLMRYRLQRFVADEHTARLVEAAWQAARETADSPHAPFMAFGVGFDHLWSRRLDQADHFLRIALDGARRRGDAVLELRCLVYLGVVRRMRHDAEGTRALAMQTLQLAGAIGNHEYLGAAKANLAWLAYGEGACDDAVRHAEAAVEHWKTPGLIYPLQWLALWPLIAALLEQDDIERAAACALELHGSPTEQRPPDALRQALAQVAACSSEGPHEGALREALVSAVEQARAAGLL